MNESSRIRVNAAGGGYNNCHEFTKAKWYEIVLAYEKILSKKGRCTVRMLAAWNKMSLTSANKVIILRYRSGNTSNIATEALQVWGRFALWFTDKAPHLHLQIVLE